MGTFGFDSYISRENGTTQGWGPHSHILMTGDPSDFFGSEILAKSDLLGSMKDAENFLGREKKQRDFLGLRKKD